MKKIRFAGFDCYVVFGKYNSGNHAIKLIDVADRTPVATVSINIPDLELEDNEVVIKDYSENEGIFKVLVEAEVVKKTEKAVQLSDHVIAPIAKIIFN